MQYDSDKPGHRALIDFAIRTRLVDVYGLAGHHGDAFELIGRCAESHAHTDRALRARWIGAVDALAWFEKNGVEPSSEVDAKAVAHIEDKFGFVWQEYGASCAAWRKVGAVPAMPAASGSPCDQWGHKRSTLTVEGVHFCTRCCEDMPEAVAR